MGFCSTSNLKLYQFLQGQRVFFFIKFWRFRVSARSCQHWNQCANGREPRELWRCHPVHPPVWGHLEYSTYDISDGCLSKPTHKLNSASRHFLHWPAEVDGSHKEGPGRDWRYPSPHPALSPLQNTQSKAKHLVSAHCWDLLSLLQHQNKARIWTRATSNQALGGRTCSHSRESHWQIWAPRDPQRVWKTQSEVLFVITD